MHTFKLNIKTLDFVSSYYAVFLTNYYSNFEFKYRITIQ